MSRWGWLVMASAGLGWRGLGAALVLLTIGRLRRRRRRHDVVGDEAVDHLAALVVIGLSASMTLPAALESAALETGGAVADEVADVLRRARHRGVARALAETEGPLADLATQLAQAQVTGAPMVGAVTAFLATRRATARSKLLERARTLPVRLIVPVALLLLPGFIVLVMGPYVIEQVGDLIVSPMP
ncbi:MAG: type II secretion system F family protein [Acidimicrobiia bacterium]